MWNWRKLHSEESHNFSLCNIVSVRGAERECESVWTGLVGWLRTGSSGRHLGSMKVGIS
jgi:hypothetical protein